MKHVVLSRLLAFALLLALSALSGMAIAQAQGSDGDLIPVCVLYFESTPGVEYLTQAQIDEIEATWAAYDGMDIPPAQITGYPDPVTGSCATENGGPTSYDPESYTLVCVRSGPEGDGPLVPQLAINIYLGDADDVILADPVTGECPQDESSEPPPADTASEEPEVDDTGSGDNAAPDTGSDDNAANDTGSDEEPTTVPQALDQVPEPEGRSAAIYSGSCDELDDAVTELPNILDPLGQPVGQSSAIEAATASTSVDVSLDALLDGKHAVVVFEANTLDSDVIACGDIGGVDNDDGELVVGLREADGSGFTGMVYLAYSAIDGSQTDVSVFLAKGLAEPRQ